jgi:hypothetical protein
MARLPLTLAVAISIVPGVVLAQSPPARTQPPSALGRIQFGAREPVAVGRATRGTDVEFARFGRGGRGTPVSTEPHDDAEASRRTQARCKLPGGPGA